MLVSKQIKFKYLIRNARSNSLTSMPRATRRENGSFFGVCELMMCLPFGSERMCDGNHLMTKQYLAFYITMLMMNVVNNFLIQVPVYYTFK